MIEKPNINQCVKELEEFKSNGGKVIGLLAHDMIPLEIIHAAGCFPLVFSLGGDSK